MSTQDYDLAVVGGGLAGKVAALRAIELGGRILLMEAGPQGKYPANSRYSGGVFHIAFEDFYSDPASLAEAMHTATGGVASADLVEALASTAARAMDWLREHGAAVGAGGDLAFMHNMLEPYSLRQTGFPNHWPGKGADLLLDELELRFLSLGGTILWQTRARHLIMDGDRCVGVEATTKDGETLRLSASSVLLADGGFQGNPDLVRRYISPVPAALCARGAGTGLGDGLVMAAEAGAALAHMDSFYGHVQCAEAVHDEWLWPYPILDLVASAAVVIGPDGRRFTDEGLGGVSIANAIARLDDPLSSHVIMDEETWKTVGRQFLLPPNPTIEEHGVPIIRASSPEELAKALGVRSENLLDTINEHNSALTLGRGSELRPPRTGTGSTLGRAPSQLSPKSLLAIRLSAGITYTMGGILIDADGRVSDHEGKDIPGLYAAGSTSAGLEGGPFSGYVGGLAKALVFGLRSAEHAMESIRTATVPAAFDRS